MRLGPLILLLAFVGAAIAAELPPCCRAPLAMGNPTDRSLYLLESQWTSDVGRTVRLNVLRGRPQVVALFFTHCEYACPIVVEDMKRIERALPDELRDQVDFLLISLDPDRDTPEALREFRQRRQLATAQWTLLRGLEDDVRELAALLGVNFRKDERGQYAHANVITLLNAEGEVVHQQPGLNQSPQFILDALRKAIPKAGKPQAVPAQSR